MFNYSTDPEEEVDAAEEAVEENTVQENNHSERMPLHAALSITTEESSLLILEFCIAHNLTDVAIEDLLHLINCHLPQPVLPSKYLFLKRFPPIATIKTFYYCPECFEILSFENSIAIQCPSCTRAFQKNILRRDGHFFINVPLKPQLSNLFSGPLFYELQRENIENDTIADITSGIVHKTLRRNGTIQDLDISIQWNADGVQPFMSGKMSMCPLQVAINELPFRKRKDNIILAGLWASTKKPVLDIFLKPFVDELNDLYQNGFDCIPPNHDKPVNLKVHTILAPVDSVERCALQKIHQYNGEYGCSSCLHPGERIQYGRGFSRVYSGDKGQPRTLIQHERDATVAENEGIAVNGVTGFSVLMLLPVFHIIRSFPPDYMHSVLLGVVRLFVSIWCDSQNSEKLWYIGTKVNIIDDILLKILPPCEITRSPQSISNMKQWKATEFKSFLFYYSMICLKGVLPGVFYRHWSLLVYAMIVFCSDKIDIRAAEKATVALKKFVSDTEILYGKEYMKYNVHLLLHIPDAVKDYGALWGWSAFPYESYNFVLGNMLHSSQSLMQQICKSYLRYQSVKYLDTFTKENGNEAAKELFFNMQKKYRGKSGKRSFGDDHLVVFGIGKPASLTLIEKVSVEALVGEHVENDVISYERFIYNDTLYNSSTYEKMYKRNNSVIRALNGSYMEILKLACVTTLSSRSMNIVIGKLYGIFDDNILCTVQNFSSSYYSHYAKLTENISTILPQQIEKKCVIVSSTNKSYIIPLVNIAETE